MLDTTPAAPNLSNRKTPYKKKLIEVALPLQAINKASAREKSIRHGHPSTLQIWWARRPLAACRAVLFASLVDDPSSDPVQYPTVEDQELERKRLFDLIEQLVQWESSLDERVLSQARHEIRKSLGDQLPAVYDPFCGGGAIPMEAQRLGLPTVASDLNPVAVLITKALTEIPWRFRQRAPVHPSLQGPINQRTWERATGLAADVELYGKWVVDEARKRIGSFYPSISLQTNSTATVIAWLWARTVRCPNPLCGAEMPLIKSFALSTKKGKEWTIEPTVDLATKTVTYHTRSGKPARDGTIDRRGAQCIVCNEPVTLAYIRAEGKGGRIGVQMMAIVADGPSGRSYLPPSEEQTRVAKSAQPVWTPDTQLPQRALGFRVQAYGMAKHRDLFTSRQLLTLTTLSDLVRECRERVLADAIAAGLHDDRTSLESGGSTASAYADAVALYLSFVVSRAADYSSNLCFWDITREATQHVFGRQTISMKWDFSESNPFSHSSGNIGGAVEWVQKVIAQASSAAEARVFAADAAEGNSQHAAFSTDPPYYDNVPYADLSDFFYVWLRSTLKDTFHDLFATLLTPKSNEIVADPERFEGNKIRARRFFEERLGQAFASMRANTDDNIPTTIFYAFKEGQSSSDLGSSNDRVSVGWEAMLTALLRANFQVTGTWPMTTEQPVRLRSINANALASSIILVCRPIGLDAERCTRADLIAELRRELPSAVRRLRDASLAATDLEQAAIGPGMAIFSRFREVLEPDGRAMSVRVALGLINAELAQILLGEIADVDPATHFALVWFDGHFYDEGKFGEAQVLLTAKNANLQLLRDSGVVRAERGIVQLIRPSSLERERFDARDRGLPAWSQLMHLIAALNSDDGGLDRAADTLRELDAEGAERIKDIAYHCYVACNRAKRSAEAQDFNTLVTAWPDLQKLARERTAEPSEQRLL
jgi:putative DNA methylase